ncbi:class I SAM-dependent methyltransferase [Methanobrevibacter sp. OttesenSCG-928-K11]|nr:class I SAM-dependent methyltransferase [Methanobrevibacter sp. OttesenSCG-928-K11]MDL2270343.1 class I SAM-dependent methyltransferase [Methanobrevibacter sp. OttesenSCG-928-I08]
MSNKTGMLPANGHRIQGRSSEDFLDAKEILNYLNLKGSETFMDAGCGDGHIAIEAVKTLNDDATIYALDIYEPSIEDLNNLKEKENYNNLIPITSNIIEKIDLDDDVLDIVLMVNVFHGFKAMKALDEAIEELKRVIKPSGRIAIMDYKKQEVRHGPPYIVRSSPEELEELFNKHGLKMTYLNNEVGEDIPEGKSHYLIIFEK